MKEKRAVEPPRIEAISITRCERKGCAIYANRVLVAEGKAQGFYCEVHAGEALQRWKPTRSKE